MAFIAANDIKARKEQIQNLVAVNKVSIAINLLLDYAREFPNDSTLLNEAINISRRFHSNKKYKLNNEINFEDYEVSLNKLVESILYLLDSIEDSLMLTLNIDI